MKKNKNIYKISCIIVIASFLIGCKKNDNVSIRTLDYSADYKLIEEIEYSGVGVPFPDGSLVTTTNDGIFELTLPDGYLYVVKTDNNRGWTTSPVIGITCTCNSGTGCNPVKFNNIFVCFMEETCSCCESQLKYKDESKQWIDVELVGMINKNAGITLLSDNPIPKDRKLFSYIIRHKDIIHGNAFEELFEMDIVNDFLESTAVFFNENNITPNVYAFYNILGNVALIPFYLPDESIITYADEQGSHDIYAMSVSLKSPPESVIKCECTSGSDGCIIEKKWTPLGTLYYCNAGNCTSCSLLMPK